MQRNEFLEVHWCSTVDGFVNEEEDLELNSLLHRQPM
jgi:hypothetical protein